MKYYQTIKKSELLMYSTKCINLNKIMLSERSWTQYISYNFIYSKVYNRQNLLMMKEIRTEAVLGQEYDRSFWDGGNDLYHYVGVGYTYAGVNPSA